MRALTGCFSEGASGRWMEGGVGCAVGPLASGGGPGMGVVLLGNSASSPIPLMNRFRWPGTHNTRTVTSSEHMHIHTTHYVS